MQLPTSIAPVAQGIAGPPISQATKPSSKCLEAKAPKAPKAPRALSALNPLKAIKALMVLALWASQIKAFRFCNDHTAQLMRRGLEGLDFIGATSCPRLQVLRDTEGTLDALDWQKQPKCKGPQTQRHLV